MKTFSTTPHHLLAGLVLTAAFVVSAGFPAQASAAVTEPPACLLGVLTSQKGEVFAKGTVSVAPGSWAYILWVSTTGSVGTEDSGKVIPQSGFFQVTPSTTTTYNYTFRSGGSSVTCSATLMVGNTVSAPQGPTNLSVQSVPLLSGGVALPGASIPVSYIQVRNTGTAGALLKGLWIRERGTAPEASVASISTVDDKGVTTQTQTNGPVFVNGRAYATTNSYFAPGQLRLFTIRAQMAPSLSNYRGTQLKLEVDGIDSDASTTSAFPIAGTAWSIQY